MIRASLAFLASLLRSRTDLALENAALRQPLAVLQGQKPRRRMPTLGRLFWVALRRFWPQWRDALNLVKPETVARWHRLGFRAYWTWKSKKRQPGRPRIDPELRKLIRRMARENSTWRAPRIHAELLFLGFEVAVRTVLRYLPKPTNPDAVRRWMIFLRQHRKALVGMDFFVVNTLSFRLLHVLFFVHHEHRQIVHWAVTQLPTQEWIQQQIRVAFPFDTAPGYLVLDRDPLFSLAIRDFIRDIGTKPVRISPRSPWQNGIAECWVGSIRRGLLHHVIVLNEDHLRRLISGYVAYYQEDRPHLALRKQAPAGREVERPPKKGAEVAAFLRCDGLHHRYHWAQAA